MYRPSDPQKRLFDAGGLLPPEKRERCESSWAGAFRRHALPILRNVEDEFADLYHAELGRPNRPVELVLGVLILKEMADLTDQEALDALEFDARWWYALEREPVELHLCQKTLHTFRAGLVKKEKSKVAFRRVTDELIGALGVSVARQRLDSTQVLSNIAGVTRLGLICETIRIFLREVMRQDPKAYEGLSEGIKRRHGQESAYGDARSAEGPRRLGVVARDLERLIGRFERHEGIQKTRQWELLARVFEEQCELTEKPQKPGKDDDDEADGPACARLKPAEQVKSDSLQSPHDADVTYSGHKGKGYAVQVAETCTPGNAAQMITEVEVTRACEGDARQTVPIVEALSAAGQKPQELVADTNYSGAENAAELAARGVNLVAPAPAAAKPDPKQTYEPPEPKCPKERREAGEWLKRQEAAADFAERYAIRAGIEATNSELKRAHGMRKLRVRGEARVKLAAYFKALACNVKRALRSWCGRSRMVPAAATLA